MTHFKLFESFFSLKSGNLSVTKSCLKHAFSRTLQLMTLCWWNFLILMIEFIVGDIVRPIRLQRLESNLCPQHPCCWICLVGFLVANCWLTSMLHLVGWISISIWKLDFMKIYWRRVPYKFYKDLYLQNMNLFKEDFFEFSSKMTFLVSRFNMVNRKWYLRSEDCNKKNHKNYMQNKGGKYKNYIESKSVKK